MTRELVLLMSMYARAYLSGRDREALGWLVKAGLSREQAEQTLAADIASAEQRGRRQPRATLP